MREGKFTVFASVLPSTKDQFKFRFAADRFDMTVDGRGYVGNSLSLHKIDD